MSTGRLIFPCVVLCCLFTNFFCSASKNNGLIHLDFADSFDTTYTLGDTLHLHPLKSVSMSFLINSEHPNVKFDDSVKVILDTSQLIQQAVKKGFPVLDITFYKKSECTTYLLEKKFTKYLSNCNTDIVFECIWHDGKLDNIFHYKDGEIQTTNDIRIKKL